MSDTPRTDAEAVDSLQRPHHLVPASFARTLERELADEKDDALRLHREKMEQYEKRIEAEAKLAEALKAISEIHRIPEGWKLVPVQPTVAMQEAVERVKYPADLQGCAWTEFYGAVCDIYREMLAAAPEAPK